MAAPSRGTRYVGEVTERPILLFDVMSTLVTEPFFEVVPAFFGMSLDELLAQKHPSAWVDFEHGRIDEATYFERFFADGRPVDGEGLKAAMRDFYALMPGVADLLDELAARGHPMYAVSNYPVWYQLIEDKLTLSKWLKWDFVSCDTGHRKPDLEAYRHVVRTLAVPAHRCVFVDDRAGNVDAAREVGMQGILRTPECDTLRADLVALGVL